VPIAELFRAAAAAAEPEGAPHFDGPGESVAVQTFDAQTFDPQPFPAPAADASPGHDQVVMRLAASGIPVVARQDEPQSAPEEKAQPAAQAVPGPDTGRGAGAARQDQELLGRLFEPLLRRLRAELWLERERRGDLADPGGRRF
jgi:hypothetical protein